MSHIFKGKKANIFFNTKKNCLTNIKNNDIIGGIAMRNFVHKLVGFDFARFRWYRKWQGGAWTLVHVESVDIYVWVKDYRGLSQCKTVREERW